MARVAEEDGANLKVLRETGRKYSVSSKQMDKYYVSSKRRGKAAERGKDTHHMAKATERKYLGHSILTRYQCCQVSAINRGIFAVWMDRKGCSLEK